MTETHWLIKDFHVLYRQAQAAVDAETYQAELDAREGLRLQLARLRPAFELCDAERRSVSAVIRDIGLPKAEPAARSLTEADRAALNALHRWLHSPGGDDDLVEAAQDYHERLTREAPDDCARLDAEERIAWANLQRYGAELAGEEVTTEVPPEAQEAKS